MPPVAAGRLPRPRFLTARRKVAAAIVLVLGGLVAGPWFYFRHSAAQRLGRAAAEADRLDPHWRLADLEAHRPVVPDAENSAPFAWRIFSNLPGTFPPVDLGPDGKPSGAEPLNSRASAVPPEVLLDGPLAAELRGALESFRSSLDEARKLRDMPRGRPPITYDQVAFATRIDYANNGIRALARLLQADAALRAQDGDIDGALESGLALLNAGRSIGDEPFIISQLVRMAMEGLTVASVQRALAQGRASDAVLARVQAALVQEAGEPILTRALRGERAIMDNMMDKLSTGEIDLASVGAPPGGAAWYKPLGASYFVHNHALALESLNRAVEISRRPTSEQIGLFAAFERESQERGSPIAQFLGSLAKEFSPSVEACFRARSRTQGMLLAAATMIAAERHRMRHGEWPATAAAIDRDLAPTPLLDPFDDRPVRIATRGNGLVVYTLGADGTDDGGKLHPKDHMAPGFDVGVVLFAPAERRRPHLLELPADVFQDGEP